MDNILKINSVADYCSLRKLVRLLPNSQRNQKNSQNRLILDLTPTLSD